MDSIPRRLIVVTEVFEFSDGTINPVPLVPFALIDPEFGERLKPGDQLELRRPDGTATTVKLYALSWPSPSKGALGIQLRPPVTKDDLPPGTEIWKVQGTQ